MRGSTLHRALNIGLEDYRAYLWPSFRSMISEGLSVVAVDPADDQILGCLIVTAFNPENFSTSEVAHQFLPLVALTSELVAMYQTKRSLSQGEAVLVDMGAVPPHAAGQGVYKAMRMEVDQIARDRGYRFILGELSSAATQHVVLDLLGHRAVAEVEFSSFIVDGARPFAGISEPAGIVMSEGDLSCD